MAKDLLVKEHDISLRSKLQRGFVTRAVISATMLRCEKNRIRGGGSQISSPSEQVKVLNDYH